MADPYSSYARLFAPRQPSARELLPEVDPTNEESTAGWLLEGALGGLGYVGSVLDKSFGARGVRGALGGKPEELLSILPLSDTLGITDPANEVSGRDLLADAGIVTRRQPGEAFDWENDLAGMAAEIALDPSTYLSLGLTGLGKAAAKSGGLAKGFGNQMRAGQRGLTANLPFRRGDPLELLSGQNVLDVGSAARWLGTAPTRGADYIADAIGGVTPFSGAQRRFNENILDPAATLASRWFSRSAKSARGAEGQELGRGMTELEDLLERERLGNFAQNTLDVDNLVNQIEARQVPVIPPTPTGALRRSDEIDAEVLFSDFAQANQRMPATAGEAMQAIAQSKSKLAPLAKRIMEQADESSLAATMVWDPKRSRAAYDSETHELLLNPKQDTDFVVVHEAGHAVTVRKLLRDIANHVVATKKIENPNSLAVNTYVADNFWNSTGAEHLKGIEEIAKSEHVSAPVRALHQAYLTAVDKMGMRKLLETGGDITRGGMTTRGVPALANRADEILFQNLPYGMSNIAEFISEALSDANFQKRLMAIAVDGPQKNLWTKFIDAIKEILGLSDKEVRTLFDTTMSNIEELAAMDYRTMRSAAAADVPYNVMPLFSPKAVDNSMRENVLRSLSANIEATDTNRLLPQYQAEVMGNLARRIRESIDPEDAAALQNLKQWEAGEGVLDTANIARYKAEATPFERYMMELAAPDAQFPAGMPGTDPLQYVVQPLERRLASGPDFGPQLPTDIGNTQLLRSMEDLINKGNLPNYDPTTNTWTMKQTEAQLSKDKKAIADALRADPTVMADPGNVEYLNWWEKQKGVRPLGLVGASEAMEKIKIPYGAEISRAIEGQLQKFEPPKGNDAWLKWSSANLQGDEKVAFDRLVTRTKEQYARFSALAKSLGVRTSDLKDSFIDYNFRQMTQFPAGDPRAKAVGVKQYARELKASTEAYLAREDDFRNIPQGTATINDWAVDPRLSGENRTLTDEQVAEVLREEISGMKTPAKGSPVWDQARHLAKWLKTLPAHHATDKVPFFKVDLPQLILQREKGMNNVEAAAQTAYAAAARAKPISEIQGESMSLKELAQKMNLMGADEKGSIFAQRVLGKDFMKTLEAGQKVTLDDVAKLGLDKKTADDVLNFNKAWVTPEILKPVVEFYDNVSNVMKTYLTRPFPSFHVRNFVTGIFNTWRSAGLAGLNTKQATQVLDFLRGRGDDLVPGVSKDELWKELIAGRIAFSPNSTMQADFLGKGGEIVEQGARRPQETGRTLVGDVKSRLGQAVSDIKAAPKDKLNPLNTKNSFLEVMTEGGQHVEDFIRTNHYVTLRKQGWTPKAAADEVMKYQIDYAKVLSEAERSFFRRAFPWLAFSKGNLPPLLEDLVSQPGKITGTMRAVTGGREQGEFVPAYIGEGAALPLGQNPDGTQRYLSSFGLPVEDEAVKMLGSLLKGDLGRAGEQMMGATFPWIKSPLELIFDKQLYSGRPLSELKPYPVLDAILPDKTARVATEIAANTPLSRFLSTAGKALDERKGTAATMGNLLTGVRSTDVDVDRAFNAAVTKVIGEQLQGQPGVRSRQEVYVPLEKIPNLSPEDAQLYALYLRYEQRMREAAKARANAQGR